MIQATASADSNVAPPTVWTAFSHSQDPIRTFVEHHPTCKCLSARQEGQLKPMSWRLVLATLFQTVVLLLCVANLGWLLYVSLFVGDEVAWVSLSLFMYGGIGLVLLLLNFVSFVLPGARVIPRTSLFIILGGFSVFLLLPHKIVGF
jgi:hypothetical protein